MPVVAKTYHRVSRSYDLIFYSLVVILNKMFKNPALDFYEEKLKYDYVISCHVKDIPG